jgi:hypothetical protein
MKAAADAKGGEASKIVFIDVPPQEACAEAGTGCQWHPSVAEHQAVADVITPVIKSKLGW